MLPPKCWKLFCTFYANYLLKENQQLLKKLFKRLDPTVSKVETDIQGDIQVSLKYDTVKSNLLVNIIKIRELGANNISGKSAEPFVTVSPMSVIISYL